MLLVDILSFEHEMASVNVTEVDIAILILFLIKESEF